MSAEEKVMIDTNVLVYGFDNSEGLKHELANELLEDAFEGKLSIVLSTQILSEFFVNITGERKKAGVNTPMSVDEANALIRDISSGFQSIAVVSVNLATVMKAMELKELPNSSYWDCLIAATMKENNITTIYTEDKAFEKIPGVTVINPFEHPKKDAKTI
ncbi:PIN domain-containing protein [Candidatus Woesearchaeota archaeon]|nr:PIN domain-containing protein [Candidatus Woesearchaeota archaeon]